MRILITLSIFCLIVAVAQATEISKSSIPAQQGGIIITTFDEQVDEGIISFDDKKYPVSGNTGYIPISVDTAPGSHSIKYNDTKIVINIASGNFGSININLPKSKKSETKKKDFPQATKDVYGALCKYNKDISYLDDFIMPIEGEISEPFGTKRVLNHKTPWGYHGGVDIPADAGTPIQASNGGIVELSDKLPVYGNVVVINHGQGFATIYMHMQERHVKEGDTVTKGEIIGLVGSTGLSTGPHLHWGLYLHGVKVDPIRWLAQQHQKDADNMAKK